MCGRYVLDRKLDDIAKRFGARVPDEGLWTWEPQYNICPTQVVPVIAFDQNRERKVVPMRWGLHPHWSKTSPQDSQYGPFFNARAETAATKPSFRTPWKRRRALIPATAWYEWTGEQGGKVPWLIKPEEGGIFAFAALWDRWRVDEGIELLSAAILTQEADAPIKQLHHRQPARLPEDYWDDWLDWDANPDMVIQTALESEDLIFYEVDRAVNSSRASGPELIHPAV